MNYLAYKKCPHEWGPEETVTEGFIGAVVGTRRFCKRCRAILWNEMTNEPGLHVSRPRIMPPGRKK